MHWIKFHIKHTAASQCSIIHLAVWTMRKDLHIIFSPYMQPVKSSRVTHGVSNLSHFFCEPLVNRGQVPVVLHFLFLLTSHAAFITSFVGGV